MKFIADFHLHSKYSRATSSQMELPVLDKAGRLKGVKVLGSGDFTHPLWFRHLKENLIDAEEGLFKLRNGSCGTRFLLTAEISCIYSKNNKVRKVHILILSPDFKSAEKINVRLGWLGNLKADGRPILGLDAKELAKIVFNANPRCLVVPGHIWTPWFSVFGSKSGFDTLEECFDEMTPYIYAGETGLSASPDMCWRLSNLDKIVLISNGDSHSPKNIAREANVFETDLSYSGIAEAIKSKDKAKFLYTIEFFPEEGKYHFDGHRICNVVLNPEQTKAASGICPVCKKPLTIGVLNRVAELADRPEGFVPEAAIPFKRLIPLAEVIADCLGVGVASKQVEEHYKEAIKCLGPELDILLNVSEADLKSRLLPEIAFGIMKAREGRVDIQPGYDGVYGKVRVCSAAERENIKSQKPLF